VPSVIYTIPPSSPLFYVTYVKIYEATPLYVYVGYTPGYLGTVVAPYGTVVYGTGYAYSPWIGGVWYAPPYTYGYAAAPIYNPWVGYTFGFAMGLATAAWMEPYWGGAYYHPGYWGGYGCCGVASANVYGHWGNAAYSGTRSWYGGGGVAGSTFSGSYATARGTTGNIKRAPVQRLDGQRIARLRPDVQHGGRYVGQCGARQQLQRVQRPALDRVGRIGHRRRRQHVQPRRCDDCGTGRRCPRRRRLDLQRQDRQYQHMGDRKCRQQSLRRRQRQRVQEYRRRVAAAFIERVVERIGRHVVGRQGVAGAQLRRRPVWRVQRSEPNATLRRRRWRIRGR
jgi:hypothetical protein